MTYERHVDGTFSHTESSFGAVYAEIKRLDQLRGADQVALAAALLAAKTAVDAALAAAEKAVAAALIAAKEAVNKAEAAQQKTNEGQNEFRAQLRDQAATFMTRNEYGLAHASLEEKVVVVSDAIKAGEGRSGGTRDTWKTIVAVAGISFVAGSFIVGLLALIFNVVIGVT